MVLCRKAVESLVDRNDLQHLEPRALGREFQNVMNTRFDWTGDSKHGIILHLKSLLVPNCQDRTFLHGIGP